MKPKYKSDKILILRAIGFSLIPAAIIILFPQLIVNIFHVGYFFTGILLILFITPFGNNKLGPQNQSPLSNIWWWIIKVFIFQIFLLLLYLALLQIQIINLDPESNSLFQHANFANKISNYLLAMQPWSMITFVVIAWLYLIFNPPQAAILRSTFSQLFPRLVRTEIGDWVTHFTGQTINFTISIISSCCAIVISYSVALALGIKISYGIEFNTLIIGSILLLPINSKFARAKIRYLASRQTTFGVYMLLYISGLTLILTVLGSLLNYVLPFIALKLWGIDKHLKINGWENSILIFSWAWWLIITPLAASIIASWSLGRKIRTIIFTSLLLPFGLVLIGNQYYSLATIINWLCYPSHIFFGLTVSLLGFCILCLSLLKFHNHQLYHLGFMPNFTNIKFRRLDSVIHSQLLNSTLLILVFIMGGVYFFHLLCAIIALPEFIVFCFLTIAFCKALLQKRHYEEKSFN